MRRLPIYFLIDVSESMVGAPIQEVQNGLRTIIQELRSDPYALETVYVSIIAFAGKAKVLEPLTEVYKFYPPVFPVGSGTALGNGLETLMNYMDQSVQKTTMEQKGDWKPIIFLFTDGTPTDNYMPAFDRWNKNYRRHCNLIAVSIGDNVNTQILGKITENVLLLKKTDAKSFAQFFNWVTASIRVSSLSISEQNTDEMRLPETHGINLEKINPNADVKVDENFAVFLAKCQTTNKPYLIKFARKLGNVEDMENILGKGFRLVGTFAIDEEAYRELSDGKSPGKNINTNLLSGQPVCPCCGNQYGFVVCECGGIFCVGENANDHCPWCGAKGELVSAGEGGMNVNRTIG